MGIRIPHALLQNKIVIKLNLRAATMKKTDIDQLGCELVLKTLKREISAKEAIQILQEKAKENSCYVSRDGICGRHGQSIKECEQSENNKT